MAKADCLEANPMYQVPIEGEADLQTSAIENLNKSELNKPKKVHQIYYVKLWPFKDQDEASKIAEAENLVEKLDQELTRINDRIRILTGRDGWIQLGQIQKRSHSIYSGMRWVERMLDHLQIALDKLNFANPHKGGASYKSTLSTEQNPNHAFKRKMLHGSRNLASERHQLKEIDRSQERLGHFISPDPLLEEYYGLLNQLWWYDSGDIDRARYREMVEKIRQIEEGKEKALSDAIAKGEPWNPLSTKRAIEEQIKLVKKITVELRRAKCEDMSTSEHLEKDLQAIREEFYVLTDRKWELSKQMHAAQNCIPRLRQHFDEMNGRYKEYLSLLSNARELARKKDVDALRTLSQAQVNEFMSEWNEKYVKTFRINYEISVSQSLENRQLSRDGRIESCDEETLAYISGLQH